MIYSIEELINSKASTLYKEAKVNIPGGTQLLSKRPEMFAPEVWPAYFSKTKGVEVWDLDGRKFIDMSIMGVGAAVLGYADQDVDNRVVQTIKKGVCSSLNTPDEVYLSRLFLEMHPWFSKIRFSRSGGEAMSIALRIARANTKRDKVFFSGYHGWSDWYLAANIGDEKNLDGQLMPGLDPAGVPAGLKETAMPFQPNSIDDLKSLVSGVEKEVAAIVIEPARGQLAPEGYLIQLKEFCNDIGAILIFDEITSGFRMCPGGIHRLYGLYPDIAVFAKSIANGYAMSAVIGTGEVMSSAENTFISSTNWTESVGPAAAIATIEKYMANDVHKSLISTGEKIQNIWRKAAKKAGISIKVSGLPSLAAFSFEGNGNAIQLNTYFVIEMLCRGFLGFRQFKASFAHDQEAIDKYGLACQEIFNNISVLGDDLELKTPPHHNGFFRLTQE